MYSPYQICIVWLDSLTPTRRTEGAFSQQAVDMDKAAMTSLFVECQSLVQSWLVWGPYHTHPEKRYLINIIIYYYIVGALGLWCTHGCTCEVSTGFSCTGFTSISNHTDRIKLVMKNPPHTAHISHSRLKECRLVLSGTRALPFRTGRVVEGKYTLVIT